MRDRKDETPGLAGGGGSKWQYGNAESAHSPGQGACRQAQRCATRQPETVSARQARVLRALLGGPLMREAIDRTAGASNGPEVVASLRRRGLRIPCELVPRVDRDGHHVQAGRYSLHPDDHVRASELLARRDG